MTHYKQHYQFYDSPIFLSQEEQKAPIEVIKDFFEDYKLSELRQALQDIREVGMTCDLDPYDTGDSRATLILFCSRVEELFEATFLISIKG